MKVKFRDPPRRFDPDGSGKFPIWDLGTLEMAAGEQVTFVSDTGSEYDVARWEWGYYATPSMNGRLPAKGLRPALTRNDAGRYYLCLVENTRQPEFLDYLSAAGMQMVGWLDDSDTLARVEKALQGS